jgi:hypothetical protein
MTVDPELRQYLVEMEARLSSSLKTDVIGAEGRIVSSLKSYVNRRSEEVETKLLTEFHKWASPSEKRQRGHAAILSALEEDIAALKERVRKLEGHPPQ